jgi:membrane protein DedA with SNARE-associated domain
VTDALIQYIVLVDAHAAVWGLVFVLVFMTVESSFVPFPSEVVMIPAGFLAARSSLLLASPVADATIAILAGVSGSLAGAFINYYLSLRLGRPFLHKYGKYFFLKPEKIERAEEIFRTYGPGTTFVCRLLPGIRQLISIPAGVSRMPIGSFSLWTGLGAGIWVTILTVIGYSIGASTAGKDYAYIVHTGKDMLRANLIWIVLACAVVLSAYIWVQNRVMRRQGDNAQRGGDSDGADSDSSDGSDRNE